MPPLCEPGNKVRIGSIIKIKIKFMKKALPPREIKYSVYLVNKEDNLLE